MKKKITTTIFMLGLAFVSLDAFCQQTLNVAGHSAKIDGMTFDYSIGEMTLVTTDRNASLIVTQGFLQPTVSTNASEAPIPENTLSSMDNPIKVYPNPTSHLLYVESYETEVKDYVYNLYDATGKIVLSKNGQTQIGVNKFEMDLQSQASGSYYLMIQKNDANNQPQNYSFKVQKIN